MVDKSVKNAGPKVLWCVVVTAVAFLAYWGFEALYKTIEAPFVGSVATNQVNDSAVSYGVSHSVSSGVVMQTAGWVLVSILVLVWVSFIVKMFKSSSNKEGDTTK